MEKYLMEEVCKETEYDIICFGPSDWWANNPSCCTHLMTKMSSRHRILYVNPVSSDLLGTHSRRGLMTRIVRKCKSILRFYQKDQSGRIHVISPVFIPIQGIRFLDILNNIMVRLQLAAVCLWLRMRQPLIWIENIRAADFLKANNKKTILYHVSDRFEECPYTKNKDKLRERETRITEISNIIICVSKELFESKKKIGGDVFYLPHGVDYDLFRQADITGQRYLLPFNDNKPIVGYFGTLTAQNDIELLEYCASNLPDMNFVFAGQITAGNYSRLQAMPNVLFLGKVPYEDIPKLCAAFDVCLLPWKMNTWIKNCNPLKLKEYLASGKPIVSVPIHEVVDNYSDLISISEEPRKFCERIRWEYENDNEERKALRIQAAAEHSWENHVCFIENIIKQHIKETRRV